jgi:hypothetical protein
VLFLDETVGYDVSKGNLWQFWSAVKIRPELTHLSEGALLRIAVNPPPGQRTIDSYLANVRGRITEQNQRGILSKYRDTPFESITRDVSFFDPARPAFHDYTDADIWVFTSHRQAAQALEWARGRKIEIPGQLSIVSLEDDPSYYHLGITYCTIDWETVGYLIAHVIIGDIPIERTSKGFIRVRAQVVERLTTR